MARYGKYVEYRLDTKHLAGINYTANRRPCKPGTNEKKLGFAWMLRFQSLDRLNWIRWTREGANPKTYNAKIYI